MVVVQMTMHALQQRINTMTGTSGHTKILSHRPLLPHIHHTPFCLCALQMTIDAVKQRINTMTGTSLHTMVLHLKDSSGRLVAVLEDSSKKLGYYSPESG